ncbi:FAD-dependent oxidoreductase [Streptomyces sp. NBC_01537]|uniref:FAD-dependent oxidoreductase n=1 Tax=Streptomyces sp. NBC_01537 TaxID=2903896 RepID=UPI0038668F05
MSDMTLDQPNSVNVAPAGGMTADLVVIGAGGAGLPAAITAQEHGLDRVVVLEKRPLVGGNAGMSGGFLFSVQSRSQREAGLGNSPDTVFRDTMAYHHYDGVDPRLVRLWVDEADETVNWLEDRGIGYRPMTGVDLGVEPSGWSNHPGSFQRVMEELSKHFTAKGGQILTRAAAAEIIGSPDTGVSAVVADTRDGRITIQTPRVVLATGGFTGNVELLHEKFPGVYDEDVYWTDTKRLAGDGIALAGAVGADTGGRSFLIKENCYSFKTKKNKPNRAGMEPRCLWVNARGDRFLDESLGRVNATTNALIVQPGMAGFALFDDDLVQYVIEQPDPFAGEARPGEEDPGTWIAGGYRTTLRDTLADPANKDWCVSANDWSEIAHWIGADPEALGATVQEYNGYCDAGRDALWAKDPEHLVPLRKPPFYALRFRPLMIDTAGPLRIDQHLRVLDPQSRPIPGLFGAGSVVGGWIGLDEHRFGTPLSWAISSGRIAGIRAATG